MNTVRIKQSMSSKRAQLALRFFTYGVMAVSTILLTSIAIFYAMGYRFNQSSLTIEQGGLLQLRSAPEGATVFVDGKERKDLRTPARAYLTAGSHTIQMRLNGYQTWARSFDLQAGQLLWLDYARLVPEDIVTKPVRAFAGVAGAEFSPDRRWLIMSEKPNSSTFTIFDLSDETRPTAITTTIPADQLTLKDGQPGEFSILEWDFGSRSVLVRHKTSEVSEVLRIDRTRPDEAVNISKLFGLSIGEVHFAGGNHSVVYARTSDVLRRLDIDAGSASATLVGGVSDFELYGEDRIAFVANRQVVVDGNSLPRKVVGTYQDGKEVLVREYESSTDIKIDLTEYFRDQYLAISNGSGAVEIIRDPAEKGIESPTYVKVDLGKDVQWLSFSSNGRMLVAGNGSKWVTHDLEVAQTYLNDLEGLDVTRPLEWLDDYYLWTDAGDKLLIVEFDGQNSRQIVGVVQGHTVSLSQNGRSLFSFTTSDAGAIMQSSRMVVEQ